MALATPIIGNQSLIVNQSLTLTNATANGTWSSSDDAIATIDSVTGLVVGISKGVVVITYEVGGESTNFSLNIQPYNKTNGFNTQLVLSAANGRINFKSEGDSDSGRFFQDFHTLVDEDLIKNLFPKINPTTDEFNETLSSLKRSIILEGVNDTYNSEQLVDKAKIIFDRPNNNTRIYLQTVDNVNAFVGLSFTLAKGDYAISIKKLLLFFNKSMTFNLYLYNDMINNPISVFEVSVNAFEQTIFDIQDRMLLTLSYLTSSIQGGHFYLGYYQKDISDLGGRAIYYSAAYTKFFALSTFAFSANVIPSPVDGTRNFDRNNVGSNNLMYGMNAEVTTYIDPTENIIRNLGNGLFDNLFGLLMAKRIIEQIIFSYRNNKIQVNIMGNDLLDKLYLELNACESSGRIGEVDELNFSSGLRKQIEQAKRVVKMGFQRKQNKLAGCG